MVSDFGIKFKILFGFKIIELCIMVKENVDWIENF